VARYLLSRLLQSAIVLGAMSFLVFALMGLMPGDPIDVMITATPGLTSADAEALRALYGLDRPWPERYLRWLGQVAQGELGYSRLYAQPVLAIIGPALGNTIILLATGLALALLIALPLGALAALKPGGLLDGAANALSFAGISIPVFWLGLMLIVLFAVTLGWLPAGGMMEVGDGGLADRLTHLILPAATLALGNVGPYLRHMRAAMRDALRQDWMRPALLPVSTLLALELGVLVSGALVTETVFAWPGMGKLIYESVMGNDFNLALTALLLATAMTLAGSVLADLAYTWLDPRIRLAE
jgi:peptide/nickel transport system permease protein